MSSLPPRAAPPEALQAGEIESYYLIRANFPDTGEVVQFTLDPQLIAGTDDAVEKLLKDNLLLALDDPLLARRLEDPLNLVRDGPPQPVFRFVPAGLDLGVLASAGLVAMLFTYITNSSGFLLLHALRRESEARILEILVASTTPAQFIGGKLLGLSALVFGQASLSLGGSLLVYGRNAGMFGPAALPP
ncbi:MAG: hypothetical protein ACE5GO_10855, partial [Anaerolineales bacterium]